MPYVRETALSQPGYVYGDHIRIICETIEAFLQSDRRGLMVSMPPRHMKSTIGTECLPAWWLSNHRQGEVIIASYNQSQARKMSRACRMRFDTDAHRAIFGTVRFSVDAVDEMQIEGKLNGRPSLIAAGVGSGLTGSGGDLIIIDDPVKDMEEAESETIRDKVYDWYTSVASTRLSPGGHIILIMTRWHHDDLAGRILNDDGDSWDVLNLPAIGDDGRALWPERFPLADLESKRRAMGSRVFEALYQGRPTPLEGGMFKRDWIRYDAPLGPDATRVRYWDKAATHGDGDWTAGCLMSVRDGRYCIEDMVRLQGSPYEVEEAIRRTARRDGEAVMIRMEQEPGSSGVDVIDHYSRTVLVGYDFRADKVTGDKQIRASPMAAAMECGNLWMVRAPWNRELETELLEFPLGKHDDQVDACSGAFRALGPFATSSPGVWFLRPLFISAVIPYARMGFISRLLERKSRGEVKSVTVDGYDPGGWTELGAPRDGGFGSYHAQVVAGYSDNPYVMRCVDLLGNAVASLDPIIYDTEGNEVSEQALERIFRRPNPVESWRQFAYERVADYNLNGNLFAVPLITVRGVEEVWGVSPDLVTVEQTSDIYHPVRMWHVANAGGAMLVDPSRMIHARKKLGLDGIMGISPLLAAGRSITQQTESRRWNLSLMRNGARPSIVVMDPEPMTRQQFEDFSARLRAGHAGSDNAGSTMVLDRGRTMTSAGFSARDMDYSTGVTTSGREIAIAMGVPPELVGDSANKTYSNAQEANREFALHTVVPQAEAFFGALSARICPHYDGIGRIGYDESQIDGLQGDEATMIAVLEGCSFMTINEKRARIGLDPVDGGDVILSQVGSVPLSEVSTPIVELMGDLDYGTRAHPRGQGAHRRQAHGRIGAGRHGLRRPHPAALRALDALVVHADPRRRHAGAGGPGPHPRRRGPGHRPRPHGPSAGARPGQDAPGRLPHGQGPPPRRRAGQVRRRAPRGQGAGAGGRGRGQAVGDAEAHPRMVPGEHTGLVLLRDLRDPRPRGGGQEGLGHHRRVPPQPPGLRGLRPGPRPSHSRDADGAGAERIAAGDRGAGRARGGDVQAVDHVPHDERTRHAQAHGPRRHPADGALRGPEARRGHGPDDAPLRLLPRGVPGERHQLQVQELPHRRPLRGATRDPCL